MEKIKILKTIFSGGIKQSEEIIEVDEYEAEMLEHDISSLDVLIQEFNPNK